MVTQSAIPVTGSGDLGGSGMLRVQNGGIRVFSMKGYAVNISQEQLAQMGFVPEGSIGAYPPLEPGLLTTRPVKSAPKTLLGMEGAEYEYVRLSLPGGANLIGHRFDGVPEVHFDYGACPIAEDLIAKRDELREEKRLKIQRELEMERQAKKEAEDEPKLFGGRLTQAQYDAGVRARGHVLCAGKPPRKGSKCFFTEDILAEAISKKVHGDTDLSPCGLCGSEAREAVLNLA